MDLTNKIIHGDAIEQLRLIPDNYFDSIVTDPPAGISFMNKKWDSDKGGRAQWIKWLSDVFIEAKRTLKPGGHALVWALPRTSHWTGMALEDAGFEVRDIVHHIFGSGFPKSLNIGKAVDSLQGNERKIIDTKDVGRDITNGGYKDAKSERKIMDITKGTSAWEGWGTALKPAVECWWLVRKPLSEKTVAENVLKWGVGGLNIDGCRVNYQNDKDMESARYGTQADIKGGHFVGANGILAKNVLSSTVGRFPANLIHDGSDEVLAEFAKAGNCKGMSGGGAKDKEKKDNWAIQQFNRQLVKEEWIRGDSGSPARFFYCAKPSRSERDRGLDQFDTKEIANNTGNNHFIAPLGRETKYRNNHPTVKAQALMKYLIKMITPPGGIVLDMFAGSGSTLVAADDMGFGYVGIEQDIDNCGIAEQRLKGKLKGNRSLDAFTVANEEDVPRQ